MEAVDKPWGSYTDYFRSDQVVFKTIEVDPHKRLSLQDHEKRDEVWFCMKGEGVATIDGRDTKLSPGVHVIIKKGQQHRLSNTGDEPLVIAEMQFGHCDELDIRRFEDDFGRDL